MIVASRAHRTALHATLTRAGYRTRDDKIEYLSGILHRTIRSSKELTTTDINTVMVELAASASAVGS
ncbi:hypothetical protein KIH74_25480 [Kineosporia sp. J2-2]|uniref:Uncharacterized protein n=1 Tax=Kineosporia corallincola TaxID=2835133 RepID=A0ABS5TMJ2_9ACTN|nr:hypothetical protein [Kineosporia corallincola]MBT0772322.1 hypothetical protein [Kineosporia corallincola]